MAPVLDIQNLSTHIKLTSSVVQAVGNIDLHVDAGETLGIVGESGCGKSMTGLSIIGLLPPGGSIVGGSIKLNDRELVGLKDDDLRRVRGNEIAMIFQDPLTSLDPTKTIGYQVAEPVRLHKGASKAEALDRAVEVLSLVGLPRPKERLSDYPHQLSGGLRQRVMIAMALANEPKLLIADEPTTALDVTIQAQILSLLRELKDRLGMAMLLMHDMGVIAGHADRVNVMYAGRVVETAEVHDLFNEMHHPYTQALLASIPQLDQDAKRAVDYCIALPPGYEAGTDRYPVLYYLHGLFEHARSWSEHSGQQTWESLMSQGKIGKFIVVMPEGGNSFYVNSYDGHERYEDFFIQELIPAIDRKYRTIANRETRGISGVSMGGYGALHLGMKHPDVFGSASAHSAALIAKFPNPLPTEGRWGFYARVLQEPFGAPLNEAYFDANNPLTLAEHPERFANLKLYFDCGDQDRYGFDAGAKELDQILTSKGFPHQFFLRPGNHGWSYLDQYLHFSLEFHWQVFNHAEEARAAGKRGQP